MNLEKTGTNLYNWWEINLVKNVSKDKESYVNQIPREVLRRLILATTDKRNIVLDPMCGTGSTLLAARDEGRSGIGIDINSDLKKIWKKILIINHYFFTAGISPVKLSKLL